MHADRPRLRPLNLGDLLDIVFRLYRRNLLGFVGAVALLQVPLLLVQLGLAVLLSQEVTSDMLELSLGLANLDLGAEDALSDFSMGSLLVYFGVSLLLGLLQALVIQPIILGALAYSSSYSYLDRPLSMLEAYRFGGGRMVNLVITTVLVSLISLVLIGILVGMGAGLLVLLGAALDSNSEVAGLLIFVMVMFFFFGMLLLALFSIIIGMLFIFVPHAVVLESRSPLAALGRSWQLVMGSLGRVLLAFLAISMLMMIIQVVPSAMLGGVIGFIFNDPINDVVIRNAATTLVSYGALILILPLQMIAYTLLYYDLRVRREGYDLHLRMQQVFAAPPAAADEPAGFSTAPAPPAQPWGGTS